MKRSELIQGIISWNNKFPLDRWWRIKHKVPFMSPVHRESSFINQLIEFEEDKLFTAHTLGKERQLKNYIPGSGDIFNSPRTMEEFTREAGREIEEMLKLEENGGRQED